MLAVQSCIGLSGSWLAALCYLGLVLLMSSTPELLLARIASSAHSPQSLSDLIKLIIEIFSPWVLGSHTLMVC